MQHQEPERISGRTKALPYDTPPPGSRAVLFYARLTSARLAALTNKTNTP